jgi:hypothetical protein
MKKEDWIKAVDILPKHDEDVLVYDDMHGIQVASYKRYCWHSYEHGILEHVTHWQPLELPKTYLWQQKI